MDVHAFDEESPLYLAGLLWPGEKGLSGHSDGDVVIHAIVDAILQAASLGDLGHHFGSDRPELPEPTALFRGAHCPASGGSWIGYFFGGSPGRGQFTQTRLSSPRS